MQNVLIHVSLRNLRRLKWVNIFCYLSMIFCLSMGQNGFDRFITIWSAELPVAQSLAFGTLEQEVAGSIPSSANILFEGSYGATGIIPLSLLSTVSTMIMWESS